MNRFCVLPVCLLLVFATVLSATAADVVFVKNTKPGQPPVQRQGEIIDLAGNQLTFRGPSGVSETIPLEQITEWRTAWSATKEQADALYSEKKYAAAAPTYLRAREEETRAWARRQIMM